MAKADVDLHYTRRDAASWRLRSPAAFVVGTMLAVALTGVVALQWPVIGPALGLSQAEPVTLTAAEQKTADDLKLARDALTVLNHELKSALSDSTMISGTDKAPAVQTLADCTAVAESEASTLQAIGACSDSAGTAKGKVLDQARVAAAESVSEKAAAAEFVKVVGASVSLGG